MQRCGEEGRGCKEKGEGLGGLFNFFVVAEREGFGNSNIQKNL
jgi:hypothetical protein